LTGEHPTLASLALRQEVVGIFGLDAAPADTHAAIAAGACSAARVADQHALSQRGIE
jgi:hypothetical protein